MSDSLETCHENLQGSDLLRDIATGKTPRKKVLSIPQKWDRTKPHPELLDELHGATAASVEDDEDFVDKENACIAKAAETPVFSTPSSKLPMSRASSAFKRPAFQELE